MTCAKNHCCVSFSVMIASLIMTTIGICSGCNDHPGRMAVDGQVKFKDGSPIGRGSIDFSPADKETKTTSGATIIDGHYHIPREKGLRVGRYIVRIYASTTTQPQLEAPGAFNMATPQELISPAFNTQSKLVAKVESVADQQFDFQVE